MAIPSSSLAHSNVASSRGSPPQAMVARSSSHCSRGFSIPRIIRKTVGGKKTFRTPHRCIRSKAASGSKPSIVEETTGRPQWSAGISTSKRPPIQAQSAGVQKRSPIRGARSCGRATPGTCPGSIPWPCRAPLGDPVMLEVGKLVAQGGRDLVVPGVGHDHLRPAVLQPEAQRLLSEEREEWDGDGAELVGGGVNYGELGRLP